jgi:hypothetical protein
MQANGLVETKADGFRKHGRSDRVPGPIPSLTTKLPSARLWSSHPRKLVAAAPTCRHDDVVGGELLAVDAVPA